MEQYKLIKKYPGSPELNTEIIRSKVYTVTNSVPYETFMIKGQDTFKLSNPQDYPEFWDKIVDYKILSFIGLNTIKGNIFTREQCGHEFEEYLKASHKNLVTIYSIERLSDGEIFTIGDKVRLNINKESVVKIITKIDFEKIGKCPEQLFIYTDGEQSTINNYIKIKQSLFKTQDGVEIYTGDKVFLVHPTTLNKVQVYAERCNIEGYKEWLRFSTKEAEEEYILLNKPCLSINDIYNNGWSKQILIPIVKKKLSENQ